MSRLKSFSTFIVMPLFASLLIVHTRSFHTTGLIFDWKIWEILPTVPIGPSDLGAG